MNRKFHLILHLMGIVILLVLWFLVSWRWGNFFLPSLIDVGKALIKSWETGLASDVAQSFIRFISGFLIASLLGMLVGTAVGYSKFLSGLLTPIAEFFRVIPPPALVPVSILVLGITDVSKIFLIAFASFWPIFVNSMDGARRVEPGRLEMAHSFGQGSWEVYRRVVFPSSLPQAFTGLRVGMAVAFISIVVAEMAAATTGLGYFILDSQRSFSIPEMFAGIIVLGCLGVIMNQLLSMLERRVVFWHLSEIS